MKRFPYGKSVWALVLGLSLSASPAFAASGAQSGALDILRSGLLGAGVGALSAGTSGGKAGTGALIGAGTTVIGGALLSLFLDAPSSSYSSQPYYAPQPAAYSQPQPVYYSSPQAVIPQPAPRPAQYYRPEPVYIQQPQPAYYYSQPRQDSSRQILRQGLIGAGVGAISAEASGGKAGKGALIGAGTNVIGGALLELLTSQ